MLKDYKSTIFTLEHADNVDVTTWALPDGAITRLGKGNSVTMTLSPDGTLLAIGSYLGMWLYDVTECKPLSLWEVGTQISAVSFSTCGKWIATSSWGGPIKIWDVKSEKCLVELPRDGSGGNTEFVFSPKRDWFAVGGTNRSSNPDEKLYCSVEVWQLSDNLQENTNSNHPTRKSLYVGTNPLAFSPDGKLLAFASPDGAPEPFNTDGYPVIDGRWLLDSSQVVVYELVTGKHLTTLDGGKDVSSISFSPCGKYMTVCDRNGITTVWNVPTQPVSELQPWHQYKVYQEINENDYHCISYAPESRLLSTVYDGNNGTISVNNLDNNEVLYQTSKETGPYNPDYLHGTRLAFESENNVHIWIEGEDQLISLGHIAGYFVGPLKFSLDGKALITTNRFDGILTWDITHPNDPPEIFKPLGRKANSDGWGERYFSVEVSAEGRCFVTSGDESSIRLWELGTDKPIASFSIQAEVSDVVFYPTGNLLACIDKNGKIYIWDIATSEIYDTYTTEKTHTTPFITFSPDGTYLISHSRQNSGQIYDVVQSKPLDRYSSEDNIQFFAFSPDSSQIWCDWRGWNSPTIDLWDIHQDEEVLEIPKPEWWESKYIEAFALSTCGQYIACSPDSWTRDGYICVWDIRKGDEPIATFELTEGVSSLVFSPDNTLLASAGTSGAILLWDLTPYL
ncbi:PD40 domain-containing protein [Candidatus Poribacteria bacterium]|nr:PD40 domain-containing protein [Candidatus Poribacteria bacterium]